jgi:hypothetical protein
MSFPAKQPKITIPTAHEALSWEQTEAFASWIDDQLVRLEHDFASFVTNQSRRSRGAGRRTMRQQESPDRPKTELLE